MRRFLNSPTADTEPAAAPDGRIAFSAQTSNGEGEIYILDNGATTPRPLTTGGGRKSTPAWSPDGTRLGFSWQHDGRNALYVVNADGSGLLSLTGTGQNQRPDWGRAPVDELAVLMQQLVARAESWQGTGSMEITDDDGQGTRSTTQLRFNLGDQSTAPRIQRITTAQGPRGTTVEEQITIGDRTWQRRQNGGWAAVETTATSTAQALAYFPNIADASQIIADHQGFAVGLAWIDPGDSADVMLVAGLADGLPIRLQRKDRRSGASTTIVYDWSTPATITAPIAP